MIRQFLKKMMEQDDCVIRIICDLFFSLFLGADVIGVLSHHSLTMESAPSRWSTSFGSDDDLGHNMWIPFLELFFQEKLFESFVPFVNEADLAKTAFSCLFSPDVLCCKEGYLSKPPTLINNGMYDNTAPSLFSATLLGCDRKMEEVTTMYGCTWTSLIEYSATIAFRSTPFPCSKSKHTKCEDIGDHSPSSQ